MVINNMVIKGNINPVMVLPHLGQNHMDIMGTIIINRSKHQQYRPG